MAYPNCNLRKEAEPIVRHAGSILLDYFQKPLNRHYKDDSSFATDADFASEKYLIKKLAPLIPGASFFAEESGLQGTNEYQWVIDPLDGTTNFAHGFPYFCVSVALTHKNLPLLGMIYNPLSKEFFYAEKGKGAYVNDRPIKIDFCKNLKDAMVTFAFAEYDKESPRSVMEGMKKVFAIRRCGALALDLAYCACGRVDVIVSKGFKWWDIAAGSLLVNQAGGIVLCDKEKIVAFDDSFCVAGYKPLCKQLLEFIV